MAVAKLKSTKVTLPGGKTGSIWIEYDDATLNITGIGYNNGLPKSLTVSVGKGVISQDLEIAKESTATFALPGTFGKLIEVEDPDDPAEVVLGLPGDVSYRFDL